jgi:Uma2 family endonuclease
VLSPSTAHHDRTSKRKLYQENGVGTLWLVDTDHRRVEVWTPEARFPVIESERVTWHPAGVREPLVIPISEFLRAD